MDDVPEVKVGDFIWGPEDDNVAQLVPDGALLEEVPQPKGPPKRASKRAPRQAFATGGQMFYHPSQQAFMDAAGPAAQANTLHGMANMTMQAWGKEHDSRVAQERERRRQEHEKELARIQFAREQRDPEGDMIRAILMS